jgi:hypothetical protein
MKVDFKKRKTVLTLRRMCTTCKARLHSSSPRLIGDEKIMYRAFFTSVTCSTENTERKMDQINADKCHYLFILMTATVAFFSVARSKKCT